MEHRLFRYFIAVAEELHFGRAARRLHITQPSLSHQILALEHELGVPLLERTKRSVRLTPAGQLFLEEAYQVVAQVERAVAVAHRASRGELGRLRIGFDSSVSHARLPNLIRSFREHAPQVSVELLEQHPPDLLLALETGRVDVVVFRLADENGWSDAGDALCAETTSREPYWVALPDDHPLAARPELALADLKHEDFVLIPRRLQPTLHDDMITRCKRAGFEPRIAQEATLVPTLVALVAAGLGVTIVPASVQALRLDGVAYRPLNEPGFDSVLRLFWRRDNPSAVLQTFLALTRHYLRASKARGPEASRRAPPAAPAPSET